MIFRFGAFELDEQAAELRHAGQTVSIQPKPLALLTLLVRERERVVSQRELLDALWPGTAVTPGSLTRAVSHARRAIEDTHRGEILKSIPRRGYRFAGKVVELGERAATASTAADSRGATPADAFVGRAETLAKLDDAWAKAQAGAGRVVLIRGAAGVGKTRLAEVFTHQVAQLGALVVTGRCRDGEGLPDFWLWTQVLRALADSGTVAVEHGWEGLLDVSGDATEAEERFRFFDSVAKALDEATRAKPLVVVLEDLQWAKAASLRLLEHVAFELGEAHLLIIGTIRAETRENGALDHTLGVLHRTERCDALELAGLSRGAVGEFLTQVIGRPPPADLTSELFARTEGVPLFVREAVRLLAERGELEHPERIRRRGIALPDRAIDLIRRPLGSLSAECGALVGAGSVLGREFMLPAAAALADVDREQALDALDEAIHAGVIEEVAETAATYRFTHSLFQESAYETLKSGVRARLHARAAQRLEAKYGDAQSAVIAELAHHHHQGIAVGDPERAYACSIAAARGALRGFAYEEAATHFEHAVDSLEHCESADPARRLETLVQLGQAHRLAGDRQRRREVCLRAMEDARALGWTEHFARAAIEFCDVSEWSPEDPAALAAIQEALDAVDPEDTLLLARLTTRQAYLVIREPERSRTLAREAAALARASGDPEAKQEALYVLHYAVAGPDHLEERRLGIAELASAARESHSHEAAIIALLDVACDQLSLGDPEGAARFREEAGELASRCPAPGVMWHLRTFDAGCDLLAGRFDGVEQTIRDTLLLGKRIDHPYAQACCNAQRMQLHRYRGEWDAVQLLFARAVGSTLGPNHWVKAIVGRNELRLGNAPRARELLDDLAQAAFADIARGIRWIGTLVEIAHLCAELDDGPRAEALCKVLLPVADHHGILPVPILYGGSVHHGLARLQETIGMPRQAVAHYELALDATRTMNAEPARAHVLLDFADLLARTAKTGRAAELAREGRALAELLGLHVERVAPLSA